MGIRPASLRMIAGVFPAARVLSLSYPDLVMSQAQLRDIVGFETEREVDAGRWHGLDHPLPDTAEVMRRMGVEEFRCVDIVASRGVEEVADLNLPHEFGRYDLVLDCGTTEHCANVWQATVNAAHAVRDGGFVFHNVPLSMLNHGFWCPQPTFYADLYGQNGWELLALQVSDGFDCWPIPPTRRFQCPPDMVLCVLARRKGERSLTYPMQTKYLKNPSLR